MAKQPKKDVATRVANGLSDIAEMVNEGKKLVSDGSIPVVKVGKHFDLAMFSSARDYITMTEKGVFSIREKKSVLDEPVRRVNVGELTATKQFTLPLQVGNMRDGWIVPFGLNIITGGTGAGKSSFARALHRLMKTDRVLAVEPADDNFELENLPIRYSADSALAYLISNAVRGGDRLPILDSLRAPLFEISGSAADKGIINAFFTRVTNVSNSLATNGLTVLATINPLSQEADFLKAFMPRLTSSVPSYIMLESRTETSQGETFTGKIAQRPDRKERAFTLFVPKNVDEAARLKPEEVDFIVTESDYERELSISERQVIAAISKTV